MRVIPIDGGEWTTVKDFLTALRAAIGAPEWHGWNPDAFLDSMIWCDVNRAKPPYTIRIANSASAPTEVRDYIALMAKLIRDAREERYDGDGKDIAVTLEAAS